jgi:hypothetical protein
LKIGVYFVGAVVGAIHDVFEKRETKSPRQKHRASVSVVSVKDKMKVPKTDFFFLFLRKKKTKKAMAKKLKTRSPVVQRRSVSNSMVAVAPVVVAESEQTFSSSFEDDAERWRNPDAWDDTAPDALPEQVQFCVLSFCFENTQTV